MKLKRIRNLPAAFTDELLLHMVRARLAGRHWLIKVHGDLLYTVTWEEME